MYSVYIVEHPSAQLLPYLEHIASMQVKGVFKRGVLFSIWPHLTYPHFFQKSQFRCKVLKFMPARVRDK